jgi:hypothetical protein
MSTGQKLFGGGGSASAQLSSKLGARQSASEVAGKGILKDGTRAPGSATRRMSASLAGPAAALARNMTKARVSEALEKRSSEADLVQKNVRRSSAVADGIQGVQQQLERARRRDSVSQLLSARPALETLAATGVLRGMSAEGGGRRMSTSLAGVASALERQMNKDNLGHLLEQRPAQRVLEEANVLKPGLGGSRGVAGSVQARALELESKIKRDVVGQLLESRPSKEELTERGVIKSSCATLVGGGRGVGAGAAAAAEKLAAQLKRDSLSRAVGRRPSMADMAELNWMRGSEGDEEEEEHGGHDGHGGNYDDDDDLDDDSSEDEGRGADAYAADVYARPGQAGGAGGGAGGYGQDGEQEGEFSLDEDDLLDESSEEEEVGQDDRGGYGGGGGGGGGAGGAGVDYGRGAYDYGDDGSSGSSSDSSSSDGGGGGVSQQPSQPPTRVSRRTRFGLALQACARLHQASLLDLEQRGALKELILDEDMRVLAAIEAYEMDRDVDEFVDTMQRIGNAAARGAAGGAR